VTADVVLYLLTAADARLVSIQAGDKRNALARDGTICVDVPHSFDTESVLQELRDIIDPTAVLSIDEGSTREDDATIRQEDALSIIALLSALPHGPIKREHDGESVQTSSNLASIKLDKGDVYVVQCSTRSSVDSHLARVRRSILLLGEQLGWEVEQSPAYPGWRAETGNSELQRVALEVIREAGEEPSLRTIHAGLEAGILKKKLEEALGGTVDAIAMGPLITGAHSPLEKVDCRSTRAFFEALEAMLVRLS
jgi:dipeptidase D